MTSKLNNSLQTSTKSSRSHPAAVVTCRSQCGQAIIELALVLPILLALTLGGIEMGRYAYIGILIGNAARAGAAYGAQSNVQSVDTNGIANAAQYDFAGTTSSTTIKTNGQLYTKLTVTSSVTCGCDSSGTITTAGCTTTTNPTAGTCAGTSRWVVKLSVTASGSFNSLFSYPGVPNPFVISRTATIPVINI
jgi:Flp pilus assembly protein TadG